jgi:IclR family transcriptional regulator, KDG regulon repressor
VTGAPVTRTARNGRVHEGRPARDPVKSADRSLALLEFLAGYPEGATFAEIVGSLDLPRSSAHGLLQTLISRRYVEPDERQGRDYRYRLGLKLAELSAAQAQSNPLLARAREVMRDLAAKGGETAHLAVLDGVEVVFVLAEEPQHSVRLAPPLLGGRVPAHAAAAGKVLLSGLSDEEVVIRFAPRGAGAEPPGLRRFTWRTVTSVKELLREIEEARRLGHAHDVEGYIEGVHCVAAPVREGDRVVAALSISIPTPRANEGRLVDLSRLVQEAASRLSQPVPGRSRSTLVRGGPSVGGRTRPVRIAWSMGQMLVPSFRAMHGVVQTTATQWGADVIWADAYDDPLKQACDVHHLIDLAPDALVLHPVHALLADELFRLASQAGIKSLCFRRPARSDAFTLFAGGDTFRQGELQIEFVAQYLGGRGNVVLLEGDPYNDNARNIAAGHHHALSRFPALQVLAEDACPWWSSTKAGQLAGDLLDRHGPGDQSQQGETVPGSGIHAIVCANDHMASAVAEVLERRGLAGRICLVGCDGERESIALLQRGVQQATVFQDPASLATEALRAAIGLARGEQIVERLPRRSVVLNPPMRPVPALDIPHQLITAENVADLVRYWEGVPGPA